MATNVDHITSQLNFSAFSKATELKKRIWFTLGALIVYRLGTYIPVPGIDPEVLKQIFHNTQGGILDIFNMFSGGALSRMTIFALNIMPYISAAIIMQLMTSVIPALESIKKEGEVGRKTINQYTRYLTVILASFQSYGIAVGLESIYSFGALGAVLNPGTFFRTTTVITLVGGTIFLMWLGEQITARGIGNGVSLIIFSGIVANLPSAVANLFELGRTGALPAIGIPVLLIMGWAVIAFICFIERSQRKILVQYPKRQLGKRMTNTDSSHLPLKINVSGVIPPIFASSLLLMPVTIASLSSGNKNATDNWLSKITILLGHGNPLYIAIYVCLIVFFSFFYTSIVFNPQETAENLRKYGGFLPGIRPGKNTSNYLDFVLMRLTVIGAAYLSFVCVLPELLISQLAVPFYFGGTSLLIVVTVTIDTVTQIQSHLLAHQYEGLIKKSRFSKGKSI
ncbi:preprotein translocase, SecY subunit [Candidatus Endolissoclinum faulkneri L2]|uniref:Protein translocase subunit SecY n=1 Tax=Candidatus Endolissoclinum faulkneri L2 TaxID=1193729 RepID=K7Z384_9PROT|nr:preprotein translocase subunit SecY [Candidatus Endolissoclinum faulkneri]AFX98418.1 preprotein translocase, SecY subunit [Candidatus Endolissoclinum faulkneri L2]